MKKVLKNVFSSILLVVRRSNDKMDVVVTITHVQKINDDMTVHIRFNMFTGQLKPVFFY